MKKVLAISGFLPSTTNTVEQKSAMDFIAQVTHIATTNSGTVSNFRFKDGVGEVEIDGDTTIDALIKEFSQLDGVKIEAISSLQASLMRNKKAQEKVNKMRETKKLKKNA